jgi:hypothetical protein
VKNAPVLKLKERSQFVLPTGLKNRPLVINPVAAEVAAAAPVDPAIHNTKLPGHFYGSIQSEIGADHRRF